jgi:hypothetical protein
MSSTVATETLVREKIESLREEIQSWVAFVDRLEENTTRIKDATSLDLIEGILRSARKTMELLIDPGQISDAPVIFLTEPPENTRPG